MRDHNFEKVQTASPDVVVEGDGVAGVSRGVIEAYKCRDVGVDDDQNWCASVPWTLEHPLHTSIVPSDCTAMCPGEWGDANMQAPHITPTWHATPSCDHVCATTAGMWDLLTCAYVVQTVHSALQSLAP